MLARRNPRTPDAADPLAKTGERVRIAREQLERARQHLELARKRLKKTRSGDKEPT